MLDREVNAQIAYLSAAKKPLSESELIYTALLLAKQDDRIKLLEAELPKLTAARDTLVKYGYTYRGGMLWKRPERQPVTLSAPMLKKLSDDMSAAMTRALPADFHGWKNWPGTFSLAEAAVSRLDRYMPQLMEQANGRL